MYIGKLRFVTRNSQKQLGKADVYFPGVHHRDITSYEFFHIPELMLSVKNLLLHEFAARTSQGASLFLKLGRNSVISYKGEVPQSNDIVQS